MVSGAFISAHLLNSTLILSEKNVIFKQSTNGRWECGGAEGLSERRSRGAEVQRCRGKQLTIDNYQLSIINYQLSIINYSLSPLLLCSSAPLPTAGRRRSPLTEARQPLSLGRTLLFQIGKDTFISNVIGNGLKYFAESKNQKQHRPNDQHEFFRIRG